jgi:nicotinate-nucleotide adenylyltransferase
VARVKVALFGGSFNPPHVGHVLAISYVLSIRAVDKVVAVPVFEHALRKQLAPFAHRMEMAERAFAWLPNVEVSAIEAQLGAPSRTLSTILALSAEHPDWDLRLMVGSDILSELHQWHAAPEIERRAPPLVLARAGAPLPGMPAVLPAVSSTDVRELFARAAHEVRRSPELEAVVPAAVLDYALAHDLYR